MRSQYPETASSNNDYWNHIRLERGGTITAHQLAANEEVAELTAEVSRRLQQRRTQISNHLSALMERDVEGLDTDPHLVELLYASVDGNVSTIFHILANAIDIANLEPTTAAVEYARRLAQHGIHANSLRRAYHVGQTNLVDMCFDEIQALDCSSELKLGVLHQVQHTAGRYIDWITQYVLDAYDEERQRWITASGNMHSALINNLIAQRPMNERDFTRETGYRLDQWHTAAVLWIADARHGEPVMALERFVRTIAARDRGDTAVLFTAVDRTTAWAWFGSPLQDAPVDIAILRREANASGLTMTLGLPGQGTAGFRRSHQQALAARLVALSAPEKTSAALSYGDRGVAIVSMLARETESTRVWVSEVLGPLAQDTSRQQRLRETLLTFLASGGSYAQTAATLNLHRNSVKYRVERALEVRGRPIEQDRLDVELALQACHFLGTAVLQRV